MANITYTVVKGDTLSAIAVRYRTTVSALTRLNNLSNPNYIVVGQVLIISGTAASTPTNSSSKPIIQVFGLQSKTDRTMYATWSWDRSNTENYKVKWVYATGDGVGFIGSETTVDAKQSVYTAPENAISVAFYVKPIAKKRKVNGKETAYWTADWSTVKKYYFKNNPPETPSVPTVEIDDFKLTAEVNNVDINASEIQFQIVKNDSKVFNTGKAKVRTEHASYSCTVEAGGEYKVRCRGVRDGLYSEWSDYSANMGTVPAASTGIQTIKALSATSVYIAWSPISNAEEYEIEYTTQKRYFGSSPNEVQSITVKSEVHHAEVTGLESGNEWFFRVRGCNEDGEGDWTDSVSIRIGEAPAPPTTWSSTSTLIRGEPLTLYWVHNSEDGSTQTYAQLELNIGGTVTTEIIAKQVSEDEEEETSFYTLDTSNYADGTTILWRVKTKGVLDTYSDWSTQRTIDVYSMPTLSLSVTKSEDELLETLESFPFYISATAGPNTQTPVGYNISIIANESYESVDNLGNTINVKAGDEVYSRYLNTSTLSSVPISANDVNLDNNITYKVVCTVSMNSGLTAEASSEFTVAWEDEEYSPNAEIAYDAETYSTYIRPYCVDENSRLVSGITLSVYRREFDGRFTELGTGIDNTKQTFITDPHPSLDYARYRIVAVVTATGAVSYCDIPGFFIGETGVIIQWDEDWTNFETSVEDPLEQPAWTGSLLKLLYNIDISDSYTPDVSLVKYIGRQHPVGYYGTQLGHSSTWSVDIDKNDKETLYAIRRLARWMGNVYVREPSGSGYWANITVSYSRNHMDTVVPITLSITRVAGGA